jgi:hypothetical protein
MSITYIFILSLQSICLMLYYILPSLWQSIMPGKISRLSQLRSSSHVHDISQWHTAPLIHFPRKKPRHGRLTESFPSRHRRRHLVAVQLLDQPAVDFLSRYNTIKQDVIQSLAADFFWISQPSAVFQSFTLRFIPWNIDIYTYIYLQMISHHIRLYGKYRNLSFIHWERNWNIMG